jgi:DNA polymerase III alpha subunit
MNRTPGIAGCATCVREKCTIQTLAFKLHPNAERHFKPVDEMERLFLPQIPDAILPRTQEIAEACQFSLDTLKYIEPEGSARMAEQLMNINRAYLGRRKAHV